MTYLSGKGTTKRGVFFPEGGVSASIKRGWVGTVRKKRLKEEGGGFERKTLKNAVDFFEGGGVCRE